MRNWNRQNYWIVYISCSLVFVTAGCRTTSHAEGGALLGAGLGTAAGAIIGSQSGHTGAGALIGALSGAAIGGIAGDAEDARDERDAAYAHARYQEEAAYQASKVAVTNLDLIDMTHAGLGDRVIVNAVETRGGQLDLSPSGIIELKRSGVSDEVIMSIQQLNRGRTASTTIIAAPPPRTVYIAPRPATFGVVIGPRPYYRYHGHHGPHHHHHHYGHRW